MEQELEENLLNNSVFEEKVIPKEMKLTFDQTVLTAGPQGLSKTKPENLFKRPIYSFKAEELEVPNSDSKPHPIEYYNILQSKNKDFG